MNAVSKGIGSKLSGSSEIHFKAHTASDAEKWFEVIRSVAGAAPSMSEPTSPISPVDTRHVSQPPQYAENSAAAPPVAAGKQPAALQTSGVTGGETVASPVAATPSTSAAPVSAVDHAAIPTHGTATDADKI